MREFSVKSELISILTVSGQENKRKVYGIPDRTPDETFKISVSPPRSKNVSISDYKSDKSNFYSN